MIMTCLLFCVCDQIRVQILMSIQELFGFMKEVAIIISLYVGQTLLIY